MNMVMASSPAAARATFTTPKHLHFTTPEEEPISYSVIGFPAREFDGEVRDWSFRQLDEISFKARLTCAFSGRNLRFVFAPTVDRMSGVVLSPRRFSRYYQLNKIQTVRRPGFQSNSSVTEGCDGTSLGIQEGFAMSAAGCPLIMLTGMTQRYESFCIAAHAGRDSLIDRNLVLKKVPSRAHFSIVDAMVAYAEKMVVNRKDMVLRAFFAHPWEKFPHSVRSERYGVYNSRIRSLYPDAPEIFPENEYGEGCLNLSALIAHQAHQHGIGRIETGLLPLPVNGDFAYTNHPDAALRGRTRNLVLVVRT